MEKTCDRVNWTKTNIDRNHCSIKHNVTYAIAIPIGIYSATHQYSIGDYIFTTWGFFGLAVPNFMLALALLYFGLRYFGVNLSGLYSPEFMDAPWSMQNCLIWPNICHTGFCCCHWRFGWSFRSACNTTG
ncbi:MAG: hypothetical protein CM1200mP6_02180 [Anaerolineaceae bacterium]|nr:MAG: hypothetical protein CM1200mP6_02180 [Anaerolineaceae bacterium]